MGKLPVEPEVLKLGSIDSRKQGLAIVAHDSVLTADEYSRAVSAVVEQVEDASKEKKRMLDLSSALRRLLQTRYDSALPLWWTFTAVEKSVWLDMKNNDPVEFGTAILDFAGRLLESLKSLNSVNSSGRTALSAVAHVVGLLFDVASLLSNSVGSLDETKKQIEAPVGNAKRVRKLARKSKELIKDLLSFTFLCHCMDSEDVRGSLSLPPAPNVSLEIFPNFLYPPFPLASKKMAKALSKDFSNVALMAEIVAVEVVLLQLVMETIDRRSRLKKQNMNTGSEQDEFVEKLKLLAVHSIWAARSVSLSEMLLDVLLEKHLPVLGLLDAKEETLVRGVLFSAVLLDPPSFGPFVQGDGKLASVKSGLDQQSVGFMRKLSVARRAVAFFRSQEKRSQLATLLTTIATWHVPPQLLKWLKSKKQRIPLIAFQDHQALTNWLVNTADVSAFTTIFDRSVAISSRRLTSVVTDNTLELHERENREANLDADEGEAVFFVDTAGEIATTVNAESAADVDFAAAAKSIRGVSDSKEKLKKRKKKKESKVLFHRHAQASTGIKRSRTEVDNGDVTDSSGEDSEQTLSKSVKTKTKKSKHEVEDLIVTGDEDADDSSTGLKPARSDQIGVMTLAKESGDVGNEQLGELHFEKNAHTANYQSVKNVKPCGKVEKGEAVEDDTVEVQEQIAAGTLMHSKEIAAQETAFELSQEAPLVESVFRSSRKKKEKGFPMDTGGLVTQQRQSHSDMDIVMAAGSVNDELDIQKSPAVSFVRAMISSEGEKTKSKDILNDMDTGVPAEAAGRSKEGSVLIPLPDENVSVRDDTPEVLPNDPTVGEYPTSMKKKKKPKDYRRSEKGAQGFTPEIVERDSEKLKVRSHDVEGKEGAGCLEHDLVEKKEFQVVEAIADDAQAEMVKDASQRGDAGSCDGLQVNKSTSPSSLLTPVNREDGDGCQNIEDGRAVQIVQNEQPPVAVLSSKKRRLKKSSSNVDDQNQIFNSIKDELVTASTKLSSADLIDALQAGETVEVDRQIDIGKLTTPRKRARVRDEGKEDEEGKAEITVGNVGAASVANSDKTGSAKEHVKDGVSPVDVISVNKGHISSSPGDIRGNYEVKNVSESANVEPTVNSMQVVTPINSPVKVTVTVQGPVLLVVTPTKPSMKAAMEQTTVAAEGTPIAALATDVGSNKKRSRTSRRRSESQTEVGGLSEGAEEIIQVKEEACVPLDAISRILQHGENQDEGARKSPDTKVQVRDPEPLPSAKLSSRAKKGKGDNTTQQSVGSETTEERLSPRRTRSGRTLGTPPPTPVSKKKMQRKLVMEPLEE